MMYINATISFEIELKLPLSNFQMFSLTLSTSKKYPFLDTEIVITVICETGN
jgi:hypothetical protein